MKCIKREKAQLQYGCPWLVTSKRTRDSPFFFADFCMTSSCAKASSRTTVASEPVFDRAGVRRPSQPPTTATGSSPSPFPLATSTPTPPLPAPLSWNVGRSRFDPSSGTAARVAVNGHSPVREPLLVCTVSHQTHVLHQPTFFFTSLLSAVTVDLSRSC